jgi:hypothetical protein
MQHLKTLGLTAGLFMAGLLSAAGLEAASIIHNPALSAAAGQDVEIEASLSGGGTDPRVRLHWRPRGKEIYRSVEMGGSPAGLRAKIPGSAVDVSGVEYYIEATAVQAGKRAVIARSPSTNALLNPHSITVRKDQTGPLVTPLSPMAGDKVDSARPVITAAFEDVDSGIDPKTAIVKIDGVVVKDKGAIQAFESLLSYMPSADLADGEHEIVVVVRDRAGNPGSAKWTVTVDASSAQKSDADRAGWRWDGRLGAQTEYGHSLNQSSNQAPLPYRPYGLNRATLDVSGRGEAETLRLRVNKSDAERADQQPVDRYTATYQNRQGVLALGDFSPNFSELSLYNLYQMRGVTLDLHSGRLNGGHTRLVGVWGQTRRAVEQGATGFAGGGDTATFAQYLYGARWQFGGPWFQMGLNSVAVNDDGDSVSDPGSQVPRYNYVSTSDVRIGLPGGLKLHGEAGVDYYTDQTPLLAMSLGTAYKAGLNWDIRSTDTRLSFDWRDLGGGFGLLPGGFTSVANPGLVPDYRGYEASFGQGLFDGQFSLDLNLNRWRDNLQGVKLATTTTDFLSINTSIAPQKLPYLLVGFTQNGQLNDANGNTTGAEPNLIVDNKTTALILGLGYTRSFNTRSSGSLNVNWSRQQYQDLAAKKLSQDLLGDQVVLSAFVSVGASSFNASAGFGSTEQPSVASAATALGGDLAPKSGNSFNASLRWNQAWVRAVLDSYLGYDLNSSSTETKPFGIIAAGTKSLTNRSTFSLGGGWNFREDQRLGLRFALATLATEDKAATVSTENVSQLHSHVSYDLSF